MVFTEEETSIKPLPFSIIVSGISFFKMTVLIKLFAKKTLEPFPKII